MVATFQPFQPIGCDGGLAQFWTESWTGAPGGYEVTFDINRSTVDCSCMDATCRKKNYKPIGDKGVCKHARLASEILWPVIAQALGASK